MKAFLGLLFLSLLVGSGPAIGAKRGEPDSFGGIPEEKEFKEDEVKLPPPPVEAGLIEFRPRGAQKNRYYVDGSSLTLGTDRVIRYSLLIRSPSGSANVSYEALRCKTAEYKVYAYGATDGAWIKARDPKWQPVGRIASNFHYSLWVDYLCDIEAVAGRNERDLIARLKGDPFDSFDAPAR